MCKLHDSGSNGLGRYYKYVSILPTYTYVHVCMQYYM